MRTCFLLAAKIAISAGEYEKVGTIYFHNFLFFGTTCF